MTILEKCGTGILVFFVVVWTAVIIQLVSIGTKGIKYISKVGLKPVIMKVWEGK